jgi:hypothetical protein
VNLDWHRLKAVVLESDDWGLCAWVPDDRAHRALANQPAFRTGAGLRYGRSTLESAADVAALSQELLRWRGGDGLPPVWQANTIVANPDYGRLKPPAFEFDELPLRYLPELPSRWARPGLWEAVQVAEKAGVWWAELHGLHHLPETAWLTALRRGENDARRALEQSSPIARAVEAGGEYDAAEPRELRARNARKAVEGFHALFGRAPTSFCPPDYRFDEWFQEEAAAIGLTTWQGNAEQAGRAAPPLRRRWLGLRFPQMDGPRFLLPPRIAFEPEGQADAPGSRGLDAAHRGAREAWRLGRPAIVSTHRMNYAHLDTEWSRGSRRALRALLERLCKDNAVFLVDHEVRQLAERRWSVRPLGAQGVLVRHYGVPREHICFPAPAGATGASLHGPHDDPGAQFRVVGGQLEARLNVGEYVLAWTWA